MSRETEQGIVFGEWQLCPKCLGNGWIFPQVLSTTITEQCDVCNGTKIIPKPIISQPITTPSSEKE